MEVSLTNMAIDKGVDAALKVLPLPKPVEAGISVAKDILLDQGNRKEIYNVAKNVLNKDGKIFKNIQNVKEVIEKDGVITGISKIGDILINNAKNSKIIDKRVATMLKDGKELIFNNKNENKFVGQEKVLNSISNEYVKLEKAINENNQKEITECMENIKKNYSKLNVTIDVINKINNVNTFIENKLRKGENEITSLEKEILEKVA